MTKSFLLLFILFNALFSCDNTLAQALIDTGVVYRDASGQLSKRSIAIAETIIRNAESDGPVSLWITLNYPFNTRLDEMTAREQKAQEIAVRNGFRQILIPLEARGLVSNPGSGSRLFVRGNGCRIVATPHGVRELVNDPRILQLMQARDVAPREN